MIDSVYQDITLSDILIIQEMQKLSHVNLYIKYLHSLQGYLCLGTKNNPQLLNGNTD